MNTVVDIQHAVTDKGIPNDESFTRWINACLSELNTDNDHEISIRIVDNIEITELNHQYRNKNKPTNVLSFPTEFPEGIELPMLGDIVICAPVIAEEAKIPE